MSRKINDCVKPLYKWFQMVFNYFSIKFLSKAKVQVTSFLTTKLLRNGFSCVTYFFLLQFVSSKDFQMYLSNHCFDIFNLCNVFLPRALISNRHYLFYSKQLTTSVFIKSSLHEHCIFTQMP